MLTMTRTEAIPYASMKAGMNWDWETIPQYLDSLDRAPKGVNCIQYMPTASLMTYVMGLEAAKTRPATEAERAEMARLLDEGMDAGLCGFSIQRLGPQLGAGRLRRLADGHRHDVRRGHPQPRARAASSATKASSKSRRPPATPRTTSPSSRSWPTSAQRPILFQAIIADPQQSRDPSPQPAAGSSATARRACRSSARRGTVRSGFAFTLENWNLYDTLPEWRVLTTGTKEEKLAKMKDPELRAAVIHANDNCDNNFKAIQAGVGGNPKHLIVQWVENIEELEKYVGKSLGQIGMEEGKHPIEVMLDLSLATDLKAEFLGPNRGFNAEYMAEIINNSQFTFPGVSDGGAHTKFFTGGAFTTDFLRWLVRDEQKITLEEAHYRLSALPAHAAGFRDRGMLREGAAADVVVYDLKRPRHRAGLGRRDRRMTCRAANGAGCSAPKGYRSIIVNGVETFDEGKCTGATPGKLLRHGHA